MRRPRTVAIVQARMNSHRFPGKMMQDLEGAPVMEWVLHRTARARLLDGVVLATTEQAADDPLVEVGQRLGVGIFRGDENDVLGRFARAAEISKAETVVRICADRPLVDPGIIDLAIRTFDDVKPDLAFNHISEGSERWPRGFGAEVLSAELLASMDHNAKAPDDREHVTIYAWKHRDQYRIAPAKCPPELDPGMPDLKLDLDTPEDLQRLRKLCAGASIDVPAARVVALWREAMAA
jgi:spore coat polysaccharide biosynthesis protein SpsF